MKSQYKAEYKGHGDFVHKNPATGEYSGYWRISTCRPQRLHKNYIWKYTAEENEELVGVERSEYVMVHATSLLRARKYIVDMLESERKSMQWPEYRLGLQEHILNHDPLDVDSVLRDVPDFWTIHWDWGDRIERKGETRVFD
jgi:hypothetical protein